MFALGEKENMLIQAAYMEQTKRRIDCLGEMCSILGGPDANSFFKATNEVGKLFGAFHAHDNNRREFRRAGCQQMPMVDV